MHATLALFLLLVFPVAQSSLPSSAQPHGHHQAAAVTSDLTLDIRGSPEGTPVRDYTAAVYEFASVPWDSSQETPWAANIVTAEQQAADAASQGADLLVLAEYGLSGGLDGMMLPRQMDRFAAELPPLDSLTVPCGDASQHPVVSAISCAARKHGIYIVANMVEKEPCGAASEHASCPPIGYFFYNVNIVLDRNGTLIQKYRKVHLFGPELLVMRSPQPRLAAFRTDFGVTFGLITCFDILFEVPAVELTRSGLGHVVFPTAWGDELPSLTALQMHSAFARGLNVTVLSSGYHEIKSGGIGSGIYTGAGVLNYTYDYTSTDGSLVTARVPAGGGSGETRQGGFSFSNSAPIDEYYPLQHYNITEYSSDLLTGRDQQLCHGEFCCQLTITEPLNKLTFQDIIQLTPGYKNSAPTYRLLVYKGHRNFAPHWATEICSVVLCANATHESCNVFPAESSAQLPAFQLSGSFSGDTTVFPSVIQQHMRVPSGWEYGRSTRHLSVTETTALLTAQLYGRVYAHDLP